MDKKDMLLEGFEIELERQGHALLATVNGDGEPSARFMSPAFLPGDKNALYAITALHSHKANHIRQNSNVEWLLAKEGYKMVWHLRGIAELIALSDMVGTVQEQIGARLMNFWRKNDDPAEVVVIKTIITEIIRENPLLGESEKETYQ